MALITHIGGIKNSNYHQSVEYLTKQHEEITRGGEIVKYEPKLDENGKLQARENYASTYLNSSGEKRDLSEWESDCNQTNLKFQKNQNENDIKAHHFVMSFPESDKQNGLTVEEAQRACEDYCREHFKGYQCLVVTHGDTDNIHSHIVVNSVREQEIEKQNYMTRCADGETIKPSQYEAGGKLVNSKSHQDWLMQGVSEMEKNYNLTQENYAGQIQEKQLKKESTRERLHDKVLEAAERSMTERDLIQNLHEMDIEYKRRGGQISVREMQQQGNEDKRNPYSTLKQIGLDHRDLTPDLYKFHEQERQSTKDRLREKVLEAAKESHNEQELIENLKQTGVDYKRGRGNEIAVRETPTEENERKGKYTRLDSLTLTPHDLTPDLYKFYKPERDDKVFEKQKKELEESIKKEVKEQTKQDIASAGKEKDDEYTRKGWENSRTFKAYSISRYNENGEPRSLLESVYTLAYAIINNELPDSAKTARQKIAEERSASKEYAKKIYSSREQKLDNLNKAMDYAKELKIDTPKQLAEKLQKPDLSADEKHKLEFLKEQYNLATNKDYCYSQIFKKRQDELKAYSKAESDRSIQQMTATHNKQEKHKKPKQKEREEYEQEKAVAEKASYFTMVNRARSSDNQNQKTGPTRTR